MQSNRVNVLFVATATAIVQGAISIVFVPFFSTLLMSLIGSEASTAVTDTGMTLAVLAPVIYASEGFVLGALMAACYNAFVWAIQPSPMDRVKVVIEEKEAVTTAVLGDAA